MTRPSDVEADQWPVALAAEGAVRTRAVADLHALMLRITRSEVRRRSRQTPITGPELDDLAHQAAADAVMSVLRRLEEFRGESRFTTWAYTFAVFEVSNKLGRHFWRTPSVSLDAEDWDRLPDRFGFEPAQRAESAELFAALRRAVDTELTAHQRQVFVALVLNGVPLDALAVELESTRNALYKTMFDARRKLRAWLVTNGYLDAGGPSDQDTERPS